MIRIVLADDHAVVREGFRQLLASEPDFAIIGEAGDGPAAIELVKRLRPDVLILDMVMPWPGRHMSAALLQQHTLTQSRAQSVGYACCSLGKSFLNVTL